MTCATFDFKICKGETFLHTVRWGTGPYISKAITTISRATPAVVNAIAHGMVDGWPAAVVGAQGMTQINADHYPPQGREWQTATVLDTNNVSFNQVNSADYTAHVANTGYLVYASPVNMAGMTPAFVVYDNPEMTGTPLLTLAAGVPGVTVDNTAKTIDIQFETAALTWDVGYYKLTMLAGGITHHVLEGVIALA